MCYLSDVLRAYSSWHRQLWLDERGAVRALQRIGPPVRPHRVRGESLDASKKEKNDMSKKLFVGGLAWATDDNGLLNAFTAHGEVTDAKVINDRDTGRSRGFGFVTFADPAAADAAMAAMDGSELDGRSIRVNEAQQRGDRRGGGGGGGGGGGRGGYHRGDRW